MILRKTGIGAIIRRRDNRYWAGTNKRPQLQGRVFSRFSNCEIDSLGRLLLNRRLPLISLAAYKFFDSLVFQKYKRVSKLTTS